MQEDDMEYDVYCEWCRRNPATHERPLPGTKIKLTLCDTCERVVGRQATVALREDCRPVS